MSIYEVPDEPKKTERKAEVGETMWRIRGQVVFAKFKRNPNGEGRVIDAAYYRDNGIDPPFDEWPDFLVDQYLKEVRRIRYKKMEPYICAGILVLMVLVAVLSRYLS